ncbi:septation protein IspZ [Phenylobacterium sp. J426]|uniref:septation protein IspZ n=1 Tax=Phenylobacterium sp. J426 TaxID=2898439 RepID=UPI002151EE41|nr:septation protein IspZ [Phenylobacterium sp. J426]MCR5874849.1 septation protein IspZ [Phenylobacterium sp. J426]
MRELAYAFRPLANDLGSSLLFALLLIVGVDARSATLIAIAFGLAHAGLWLALGKPVALLQWASLALVLLFGTAALFTDDPRFLMAKPTLVYLVIAAVMLKRGWMLRYLPPIAAGYGERLMIAFGYVWAGLMLVSAAANLAFALRFPEAWPLYKATFPIGSKLVLFAIQFTTVRAVVRAKLMAEARLRALPAE